MGLLILLICSWRGVRWLWSKPLPTS